MGLRINTNVASITAQKNLGKTLDRLNLSLERLSSGSRINRAADDAAGLSISENFRSQIRSLGAASRNAADGISLIQTAEGAYDGITSILHRLRELAVQSNTGTLSSTERGFLETEFDALVSEITRIADATSFNNINLLDGSTTSLTIQVGTGTSSSVDEISLTLADSTASGLSIDTATISVAGASGAEAAITSIDSALSTVNTTRSGLGAAQNRLQAASDNLSVSIENLSAANSRVRDVDVASETAEFTRSQILAQAGSSILAQANASSQLALSLLG